MTPAAVIPVPDASAAGQARRTVSGLAQTLHWSEELTGKAALIATELATNLAAHARDGELIVRLIEHENVTGLELLSVDRGPGIADVERSMQDGFSTSGTAGKGMSAIRRNAHVFDLHSVPGKGTVVLAQLWSTGDKSPRPEQSFELGVVSVAKPGEQAIGDGWACHQEGSLGRFMVVDGLGHGLAASSAARTAEQTFLQRPEWPPDEQLRALDQALRSTRGAAASIAEINADIGRVRFAGIGNVSGAAIAGGRAQRMVSLNGTLGHVVPRLNEFHYEWAGDGILIMHSDGLGTSWKLDAYPGLRAHHPGVIAATLYRDYFRGRDDATVLVVKDRRAGRA